MTFFSSPGGGPLKLSESERRRRKEREGERGGLVERAVGKEGRKGGKSEGRSC